MRRFTRLIAPVLAAGALALAMGAPLLALDAPPVADAPAIAAQEAEAGRDVVPPLIWAFVGAALFCGALGVLYLLKRELGGFELKPGAWTAPISIIPSRTLPEEESDYPEPGDDGHGH